MRLAFRQAILFTFSSSAFMEFKQLEVRNHHNLKEFSESEQYYITIPSYHSLFRAIKK